MKAWINSGGPSSNEKSQTKETAYVANKKNLKLYDTIGNIMSDLESEKNKLKEELKIFEDEFLKKKKFAEDEINKISKEKEMIEKTINVIKNLKSF